MAQTPSSPEALLFFLAHRLQYRPQILSDKEVFCGPDTESTHQSGRLATIRMPAGSFDAPEELSKAGYDRKPEIILVKADSTERNFPRNLKRFNCPRVLLVGDTHHMGAPIQKLLTYAKQEEFDRIIFDHTRHHAQWFLQAGFQNLHWLPAWDYHPFLRKPSTSPRYPLTFVGKAARHHPFRCSVLKQLKVAGFPLEVLQAPQHRAADIYADSLITLNITLNADVNMRFFEALSAGAFLLSDRLTASSGLYDLFTPGEDLDDWGSVGELMEKIRYYAAHPELVERIRTQGQAKLIQFHSPEIKIRELYDLVFNGRENPLYSLREVPSSIPVGFFRSPMEALPAYEFLQELHRTSASLNLYSSDVERKSIAGFADLPRVRCLPHREMPKKQARDSSGTGELAEIDVLWIGKDDSLEDLLRHFEGIWVIAPTELEASLSLWGFNRYAEHVFKLIAPHARAIQMLDAVDDFQARLDLPRLLDACTTASQALALSEQALRLEEIETYKAALQRALFLDRDSVAALFQVADLCLQAGSRTECAIVLSEADRVSPLPAEIRPLYDELFAELDGASDLESYKEMVAGGPISAVPCPLRYLIITNLFPPQELGGYGRMIWEFADGLNKRGHAVRVLAGNAEYLGKTPDPAEAALESIVSRSLELQGGWRSGKTEFSGSPIECMRMADRNAEKVLQEVRRFQPDVVLLGNADFLGAKLIRSLLNRKLPVLHALANATPGYVVSEKIDSPDYWVAPCSDWNGKVFLEAGFTAAKVRTLYPGARIDRFYRYFLPDIRRLRIAYASLVMPYKGAHVLVDALTRLHGSGVDFEAEIAGDTTDPVFLKSLVHHLTANGMSDRVKFTGFLGRRDLASLFARSNVLVFPSLFPEPFGISQVEAMASGLIVVSSGSGGAAEIIRHRVDGILFDAKNPSSLAASLLELANNPELRKNLQRAAQSRALDFSVHNAVARIEELSLEMLASRNVPPTIEKAACVIASNPALSPLEKAEAQFAEGFFSEVELACRCILEADPSAVRAWILMGKLATQAGDSDAAIDFLSTAMELAPQNSNIPTDLAEACFQKGSFSEAEGFACRALELDPQSPQAMTLLARILMELQRTSEALSLFQKAVRSGKNNADAHLHHGLALLRLERDKEAVAELRRAAQIAPDAPEIRAHLAIALEENKKYIDALVSFDKAIQLNPHIGFVWYRKGKLLNALLKREEALPALKQAVELQADNSDFQYEYALCLQLTNQILPALTHYDQAIALGLDTAEIHCNRGCVLKDLRRYPEALKSFHRAVMLKPENVNFINNLGAVALEIGLNTEALDCFKNAVDRNPNIPTANNNIGNLLKDRACADEALPYYRRSLEIKPLDVDTQSNFLLCHQYLERSEPEAVFEEHRKWGLQLSKHIRPAFNHQDRRLGQGSKIRIGVVSADLCQHPVASFIEPFFECYDRARFEVFAYADFKKPDSVSLRLSAMVDCWRETATLDDPALAKLIHEDRIEILFDLAGHTGLNRLGVFALKPAPVQVTYLGYPSSTGLPTIHYRITDSYADPVGMTEQLHTEKLLRLPGCAWCYKPHPLASSVVSLPALDKGFITFGCFNNMAKWNPPLYELWIQILHHVPNAHLRLKAKTLLDVAVREGLSAFFVERGIAPDRLEFSSHTPTIAEHFLEYNKVDIALDSFPYHGTTTTCEAMWMGVPVVSLAGKSHLSRVGVSLLSVVGLPELVAQTPEDYVRKAVELAANLEQLSDLRAGFRDRMLDSDITNGIVFAQRMGESLSLLCK